MGTSGSMGAYDAGVDDNVRVLERRREPRVEIARPSRVISNKHGRAARLIDLSCSGAQVELDIGSEPPATVHTMVIDFGGGQAIRVLARIVWRRGPRYAVSFVALDDVDRLAIAEQLDALPRVA